MNVCGTTRLIVPAFLVGLAIATVTGNDLVGWIAAAVAIAVLAVVSKVRGTSGACEIPPAVPASTRDEADADEAGPADLASR